MFFLSGWLWQVKQAPDKYRAALARAELIQHLFRQRLDLLLHAARGSAQGCQRRQLVGIEFENVGQLLIAA